MTNEELNHKINQAFTNATPDVLDSIMKDCKAEKGAVKTMSKKTKRKQWTTWVMAAAASAALLLSCVGMYNGYRNNYVAVSAVSLDVNPGIEIKLNKKDRVLDVVPLNADGKKVIGEMDFKNADLEVTVNALVGSMLKNGYLSDNANSILVSVDGENAEKSAQIQKKLSSKIDAFLKSQDIDGAVLSQIVEDHGSDDLAEKYGISEGKAQFVEKLLEANPKYTAEELVKLTVNELNVLAQKYEGAMKDMNSTGEASEKAYIGREEAKAAALAHTGIAEADALDLDVELELKKGVMVYEVEFDTADLEYEVLVDAKSGEIVNVETEDKTADDDMDDDQDGDLDDHEDEDDQDEDDEYDDDNDKDEHDEHDKHDDDNDVVIPDAQFIGREEAKRIALTHAGVREPDALAFTCELEMKNGNPYYDVEFTYNGIEYDYDIDAKTGKILKNTTEKEDDL